MMKKLLSLLLICLLMLGLGACGSKEPSNVLVNQDTQEQITQEEIKKDEQEVIIEETKQEKDVEEIKEDTKKEVDSEVLKTYKYWVVFFDHDGNEIQREAIKWGTTPTYWSDIPYYEDGTHWYKFTGWKDRWGRDVKEFKPITGNTRFYAQYEIGGEISRYHSETIPEPTPTPIPDPVPDPEYQQVTCLTSIPGAYINTKVLASNDMKFDFDAKMTYSYYCRPFGYYHNWQTGDGFLLQTVGTGFEIYYGNGYKPIADTEDINKRTNYEITYSGSSSNVKINGIEKTTFTCGPVRNEELYLFSFSGAQDINADAPLSIYYMKIYQSGELVRDYIPVRTLKELDKSKNATDPTTNISSGTLCMYDKVTKKYYLSSGINDFSDQTDVIQLSCLTTSGNSGYPYINTKIKPKDNTKFIFEAKAFASSQWSWFAGASKSYQNGICIHVIQTGYEIYYGDVAISPAAVGTGDRSMYEMQVKSGDSYLKINGSIVDGTIDTSSVTITPEAAALDIYVFAENFNGAIKTDKRYSMYYFKLYQDDELKLDLVPVLILTQIDGSKNATNPGTPISPQTYCFYDKVSQKYYLNSGGGSFSPIPINS